MTVKLPLLLHICTSNGNQGSGYILQTASRKTKDNVHMQHYDNISSTIKWVVHYLYLLCNWTVYISAWTCNNNKLLLLLYYGTVFKLIKQKPEKNNIKLHFRSIRVT